MIKVSLSRQDIPLPEYRYKNIFRKIKKTKGRTSGGVFVHQKNQLKNILLVKIKGYIHATRKVYIGVHNSPKYSNYTKENRCNGINPSVNTSIERDFNGRVGAQDEYII